MDIIVYALEAVADSIPAAAELAEAAEADAHAEAA